MWKIDRCEFSVNNVISIVKVSIIVCIMCRKCLLFMLGNSGCSMFLVNVMDGVSSVVFV